MIDKQNDEIEANELQTPERVIDYIVSKYYFNTPLEREELFQIGYLGYLKARQNFDPEYGQMTLKYATFYIRQEINKSLIKENKEIVHGEYFDDSTGEPDKIDISFGLADTLLAVLTPKERLVVEQTVMSEDEKSMAQLGKELGVSRERIRQIKARALGKMKIALEEDNK